MPCRADGAVRGVGILRLRSGRALRLREPLRLANRLAALRMTIRQRDPAGAEARWFSGAYAALKRRSSTVMRAVEVKVEGLNRVLKNSEAPTQRLKALLKTQHLRYA